MTDSDHAAQVAFSELLIDTSAPWPVFLAGWRAARAACRPSDEVVAAAKLVLEKHAKHVHLNTGEVCAWARLSREIIRLAGEDAK